LSHQPTLRDALSVKQRVYQALIVRYLVGRYGRGNIGFLWVVAEPMLFCGGVMLVWTITKGSATHGINVVALAYTGYLPLLLWRHLSSMQHLLRASKHLTIFRDIHLLDAVFTRFLLDFVSISASALIVYLVLQAAGSMPEAHDWSDILHGWFLMGALGFGAGLLTAALSELSEIVEKLVGPVQYFLLPFCGCFYMVTWLPDPAKDVVWYIPLLHSYELIRGGFFGPEIPTYATPAYGWAWALALTGLGFAVFRLVEDHVGQK
jgi:capsular polysaccharide transport system permease protein